MNMLGLDIGYSNLKVAGINDGESYCDVLPAGAGPSSERAAAFNEENTPSIRVTIGGRPWDVGVPQSEFPTISRQLSDDYSRTEQYLALFYAALKRNGAPHIDCLVTGLPYDIHKEGVESRRLVELMQGEHEINPGEKVVVKDVRVIPQPLGSFLSAIDEFPDYQEQIQEDNILVIDPGFFSCDFVLIQEGRIIQNVSGHNCHAMSRLLETMSSDLRAAGAGKIAIGQLEQRIRADNSSVFIGGKKQGLSEYTARARDAIAGQAIKEIRNAMRALGSSVNLVIITGGGAKLWEPAVKTNFPEAGVLVFGEPVGANARGFLAAAEGVVSNEQAA
jgi:plasmid segregation protein ParM